MGESTGIERSWVGLVQELRDCPRIEVYEDAVGALDEELRSAWGTPDEEVTGEFCVTSPHKALLDATPPALWHDALSPEESRVHPELRVLDRSDTGSGWLTAIRARPGGVAYSEVWFNLDRRVHGYQKLDVDCAGYLAALRVTKGTAGWQLLFADVSLRDDDLDWVVDGLRTMLDVFPDLFPEHDYAPLRHRLEGRLDRRG